MCPRCLLRNDVSSHLVFVPDGKRLPDTPEEAPPKPDAEPGAASAELG
jgi:hypothetical protein